MKHITMNKTVCGGDGWHDSGTVDFIRVSRWIEVKCNYNPSKTNSLWCYVMDGYGYHPGSDNFDPENNGDARLDYFTWDGRTWAVDQFLSLGNPFWNPVTYSYEDDDGKRCYLSGVDSENYFNPIYVEFDEYCEKVRVYKEA